MLVDMDWKASEAAAGTLGDGALLAGAGHLRGQIPITVDAEGLHLPGKMHGAAALELTELALPTLGELSTSGLTFAIAIRIHRVSPMMMKSTARIFSLRLDGVPEPMMLSINRRGQLLMCLAPAELSASPAVVGSPSAAVVFDAPQVLVGRVRPTGDGNVELSVWWGENRIKATQPMVAWNPDATPAAWIGRSGIRHERDLAADVRAFRFVNRALDDEEVQAMVAGLAA